MQTLDKIIEELKKVPSERLEDLYAIVHSFIINPSGERKPNAEILSYAGMLGDWSEEDFKDFIDNTKETRAELFSRDISL